MDKPKISVHMHKPDARELIFFLLSGAVVSVPLTLFINTYFTGPLVSGLSTFDVALLTVAVFAPFVEEFAKVFPLFYRHGETQRSIFTLALFSGLGFGIVEFITYVIAYGPAIIPQRLPGLFFHPASTSITAYGIATKRPWLFYLGAVSLHFMNNFFVVLTPAIDFVTVGVLGVTLFASWQLHNKTKEVFIQDDVAACVC